MALANASAGFAPTSEGMWVALALAFAASLIILWKNRCWHRHQQKEFGPRMYPLIGMTLEFLRNKDRVLDWETEYLIRHPTSTLSLKRIGVKPYIVTANPAVVEHILKTNFENYPKSDYISQAVNDLLGSGIFNADGDLWKMQRKLASYEFTTRSLRDYLIDSLNREVEDRLIPTIASASEAGTHFDLQDVFMRLTFDSICNLAFGVDPACLGPTFPDVKFARAFDSATSLCTRRLFHLHPSIWKAMRALNIGPERRLREALGIVNEFAGEIIRKRREALETGELGESHQDLLTRFVACKDQLSDKFLRDIIISFVLAGKDTTSVTLTWFFWLLSRHPEVKHRIVEEVEKIRSQAREENVSNKNQFTYQELREMNYLHAAISETLRLHPAVPVDMNVALETDVLPTVGEIKRGTRVNYHIYAMGRMESLWGKDCLEFKPERWIDEEGKFVAANPYKFPAFQAGPRICLGREMAMLQMKFVAAALLLKFDFEVVRKIQQDETPRLSFNMTLQMQDGLLVRARKLEKQTVA